MAALVAAIHVGPSVGAGQSKIGLGRGPESSGEHQRERRLGLLHDDPARRVAQHRDGIVEGFTKRHCLKLLVFVEFHDDIRTAIQRETSIKRWPRAWKINLIIASNPDWDDLYEKIVV